MRGRTSSRCEYAAGRVARRSSSPELPRRVTPAVSLPKPCPDGFVQPLMKTSRSLMLAAAIAGLGFLSGCNTFHSRARQRSETFDALSPAEQQRLQRGKIGVGDNADMVY